jgi:DMSO/TMAO reductase YedYZ molybdopterin-dependent catalytic subunit
MRDKPMARTEHEHLAAPPRDDPVSLEELGLALRNHGLPLEGLRYAVTPVGMHYLLTHFDIPWVDPTTWRLEVGGMVRRPLSLSLEELRARPAVTLPVTMECAGNGRAGLSPRAVSQPWFHEAVGTGAWTGTPLRPLLEEAGLAPEAVEVVFSGLDRGVEDGIEHAYERSLPPHEALRDDVILAWDLNGLALPPQHGFPVRLVVPGWYGMASVKWLGSIRAVGEPFRGIQQAERYLLAPSPDEPGTPITRIAPRSLMIPPGVPDFLARRRFLDPGPCRLEGRAWSGHGAVERVEVSADGGATWREAELAPPGERWAWRAWAATWEPTGPGDYELCSRAADAAGNEQPLVGSWNVGGYVNNAVQRVPVTVRAAGSSR